MNNYDLRKIKIEEKIGVAFALLAGVFLCIASVTMFINMVTRTAADVNIKVVYELCQLCGAGVASFTIPYATIKGAHTEMDIVTSHINPKVRCLLEGIAGIVTVIAMLYTVYMLADYAMIRTRSLELTTTNHLPLFVFRWVYAFGMLITLLAAVIEMIDAFRIAMGKKVIRNQEQLEAYLAEEAGVKEIGSSDAQKTLGNKDGGEETCQQ